jgi:hypothetical protein
MASIEQSAMIRQYILSNPTVLSQLALGLSEDSSSIIQKVLDDVDQKFGTAGLEEKDSRAEEMRREIEDILREAKAE